MGSQMQNKYLLTEAKQNLIYLIRNIEQRYEIYKQLPTKHHLFKDEWSKFWHSWIIENRSNTKKDHMPEWNLFWKKRAIELCDDEIRKEINVAVYNYPELFAYIDEIIASAQIEVSNQNKSINVLDKTDDETIQVTDNINLIESKEDSITLFHVCRQIYYLDYDMGELKSLVADLFLKTLTKKPEDSYFMLNNFSFRMLKMIRSMLIDKLIGEYLPVDTKDAMDDTCNKIGKLLNNYNRNPRKVVQKKNLMSPETYRMKKAIEIAMRLMKHGMEKINTDFLEYLVSLCVESYELNDSDNDADTDNFEYATEITQSFSRETPSSDAYKDINSLVNIYNKLPPEHQSAITKSFTMSEEKIQDIDMRKDQKLNDITNVSIVHVDVDGVEDDEDYDLLEVLNKAKQNVQDLAMVDTSDDSSSELIIDLSDDNSNEHEIDDAFSITAAI